MSSSWSIQDSSSQCVSVLERLRGQREQGRFCDLLLRVQGRQFQAHRCVMASCSPWFDSHLKMHKTIKEELHIDCANVETFYALLTYCYTGQIVIDGNNVGELLGLASHFAMNKLRNYCSEYLLKHLNPNNALSMFELSLGCNCVDLYRQSLFLVQQHFESLMQSSNMLSLSSERLQILLSEKIGAPAMMLDTIAVWVMANLESRERCFGDLLDKIVDDISSANVLKRHVDSQELYNRSPSSLYVLLSMVIERQQITLGSELSEVYSSLCDRYETNDEEVVDDVAFLSMAIRTCERDLESSIVNSDWFLQNEDVQQQQQQQQPQQPQGNDNNGDGRQQDKDAFVLEIMKVINDEEALCDANNETNNGTNQETSRYKRFDPKFRAITEATNNSKVNVKSDMNSAIDELANLDSRQSIGAALENNIEQEMGHFGKYRKKIINSSELQPQEDQGRQMQFEQQLLPTHEQQQREQLLQTSKNEQQELIHKQNQSLCGRSEQQSHIDSRQQINEHQSEIPKPLYEQLHDPTGHQAGHVQHQFHDLLRLQQQQHLLRPEKNMEQQGLLQPSLQPQHLESNRMEHLRMPVKNQATLLDEPIAPEVFLQEYDNNRRQMMEFQQWNEPSAFANMETTAKENVINYRPQLPQLMETPITNNNECNEVSANNLIDVGVADRAPKGLLQTVDQAVAQEKLEISSQINSNVIEEECSRSTTKNVASKQHPRKAKLLAEHRRFSSQPKSQTTQAEIGANRQNVAKLKCEICAFETRTSHRMRVHKRQHEICKEGSNETTSDSNSSTILKCPMCDFSCNCRREHHQHVLKTHFPSGPPFKCSNCEYKNSKLSQLLTHLRSHESEGELKCDKCDFITNCERQLKRHQSSHLPRRFQCEICQRSFSTATALKVHGITHSNEKPFKCDICGLKTKYRAHLALHQRVHDGRAHRCDFENCDYTTPKMSLLEAHKRTHTRSKQFVCQICNKGFVEKSQLRRHEKIHSNHLPFECNLCSFRTRRKDKLKAHLKRIHNQGK